MIDRLPAPLHVAGLRLAHAVRRRWWWLRWRLLGRTVRGCRVLVFDSEERLLLIRHSYGKPHWTLPGGGIGRGEDILAAAAREVHEECACRLNEVMALGEGDDVADGLHQVHLVAGWTCDTAMADGREIVAARFFALTELPEPLSEKLAARLPGYLTRAKAARAVRLG